MSGGSILVTKPKQSFWKKWLLTFLRYLDSGFSRLAIFASLVAFFGLQYSNIPYAWTLLVTSGAFIVGLALWTKPPSFKRPNLAAPLDLVAVNEYLADTPRVGLLGMQNVGKTTFLDATISRQSQRRQTEKPYGQFVSIPDSDPERHLVLLDSVGGKDHVQFLVQGIANTLVFFVDHSESDTESAHDTKRLDQHRDLARQLVHTSSDNNLLVDRIIIVGNKSDLWQTNPASSKAVREVIAEIRQMFLVSPSYRIVEVRETHSNESRQDVALLLTIAG